MQNDLLRKALSFVPLIILVVCAPLVYYSMSSLQIGARVFDHRYEIGHLEHVIPLGDYKSFDNSALMKGRALLNVFASWCSECKEEHMYLRQLYDKGVVIYGINYSDASKQALAWLRRYGNVYSAIVADELGSTTVAVGITGVPETFLVEDGFVIKKVVGALNQEIIDEIIVPFMGFTEGEE